MWEDRHGYSQQDRNAFVCNKLIETSNQREPQKIQDNAEYFYIPTGQFNKIFSSRSVFKPFIFVPNISQLLDSTSPTFELEDPVKKKPHFKTKPDRRHPLYKEHQQALEAIDNKEVRLDYTLRFMIKNSLKMCFNLFLNFGISAFFPSFTYKQV